MKPEEVLARVITIMDSILKVEGGIKPEMTMAEMGLDSLDLIETIMDVEEGLPVDLNDFEVEPSTTVAEIADAAFKRLSTV